LSYTGGPKPSAAASVTANDLVIDGVPVTSVVLNGTFANRVITVPNFRATQGGAFVQASGTADLDGKMVADVDVSNVPLSMFNSLIPHSRVLSGKISTLSATLSGLTRSPDVQASISIANPELALRPPATAPVVAAPTKTDGKGAKTAAVEQAGPTYKLDEIRSGTITVASPTLGGSKILTVNDLTAFRDGRPVATFSGSMPFRWTNIDATMAQLPTDEPLHAKLVVNDLSILALALPSIDPSRTGGVLTATVDANDPRLATPLAGSVTVSDASLGILGVDTYLKKIDANITFDQAHAVVNSFNGASNIKGNFAVSGGVDFRGSDNLNLKLALNALQFNEHTRQSLLNRLYSSAAQGKITGALAISGPFKSPLLANSKTTPLVLSEANFGIPSPQEQAGGAKPVYSVDPRFNVYAAIGAAGKSVTVKNALLNADVAGTAHVAGSMSDPRFDSILTVNRGRFVIPPATVLRLDRGGTVALHYPTLNTDTTPGAEPYIMSEQVSLTAETNVSASPAQLSQSASAISGALSGGPSSASLASLDTQRTEYHITVDAEGSLNDTSKLNMTYTSDPPLEKSQILALLSQQSAILGILRGGAGSGDVVAQELSSIVNSVGVGMLLNPVETNLAQALGLSSFVVDYSPDAPVVVTLTKPLGHRLEASFQRSFGARAPSVVNSLITNPQYQLKLSYSLSRRLRLSVSTDDQQNNTVAIEGVIGF
jgi:opacity protein-like surface antigen